MRKKVVSIILVVCMMILCVSTMLVIPVSAESTLNSNLKLHYNFDSLDSFTPIYRTKYTHTLDDGRSAFVVENGTVKNTDAMVGLEVPSSDVAKFDVNLTKGTYYLKFKVASWSSATTCTVFDMRKSTSRSLAIGIEKGTLKVWADSNSTPNGKKAYTVSGAQATDEFVEIAVSFEKGDTDSAMKIFYKEASASSWTATNSVTLATGSFSSGVTPKIFSGCFANSYGSSVQIEIDDLHVYTEAISSDTINTTLARTDCTSVHYDFNSADCLNSFNPIFRTSGTYGVMENAVPFVAENGVVKNKDPQIGLQVSSDDATKFDVNQTNGTYYFRFKIASWSDSTNGTIFDMRVKNYRSLALGIQNGAMKIWAAPVDNGNSTAAYEVAGATATDEFVEVAVSFEKGDTDSTMKIFYKEASATSWTATNPVTLVRGSIERSLTPRIFSNCFDDQIGVAAEIEMDDLRIYDKTLNDKELLKVSYEATPKSSFTPNMEKGAAVRLVTNSQGIRFQSTISEATISFIDSIKDTGTEVSFGTVIAPLDYVNQASDFTMAELDKISVNGAKYVNIAATDAGKVVENGNVTFNAALVNLNSYNHTRDFAARAYISFVIDGETVIYYCAYNETDNVRNMAEIAQEALDDLKNAKDEANGYVYEVSSGKWSCYSNAERTALNGYLN